MKKKQKGVKINWVGVAVILLIIIFSLFLFIALDIYNDVENVEARFFNLYQEMKTTNEKIDQFAVAGEDTAEKSLKFSEATKNWRLQHAEEFSFQFKTPNDWGSVTYTGFEGGQSLNFSNNTDVKVFIKNYNDVEAQHANAGVREALQDSEVGLCENPLFDAIKSLDLGEIRACYTGENILNQKSVFFRLYNQANDDRLNVVYPQEEYFVRFILPKKLSIEQEYFIQSFVFLR